MAPLLPRSWFDAKRLRYVWSFVRGGLVHVNLQILYDCNFRCRICDFWTPAFGSRPRMRLEDARVLSERLAELGPMIVSVGGGEPLLHEDLVGIVEALARHHFPVMICNGWHITAANARALFQAGIHEVSISVDYADAARHDAQRGMPGAFMKAMEALRILEASRIHPWQRVHMISVVMEDNLDDLEPLILRCRDLGITYLVSMYSPRRGRGTQRIPPADASARLLDLHRRYPEFVQLRGYLERFTEAFREGGVGPCHAGQHLFNVDCQGQASLCIDRMEEPVGNLLVDEPREVERRLLEAHRANACTSCWTSCRGSIETLTYGPNRLGSLWDYARMVRPHPLKRTRA